MLKQRNNVLGGWHLPVSLQDEEEEEKKKEENLVGSRVSSRRRLSIKSLWTNGNQTRAQRHFDRDVRLK